MKKVIIISLILASCTITKSLAVPQIISPTDKDNDGIDDYTDIVESARSQIGLVTKYDISYYSTAFPPEDSGACADIIWRTLKDAGYDFKSALDNDIAQNPSAYSIETPDPNIDFRRVRNIRTYFDRNSTSLTTEVLPWDKTNLKQWQGGDFVTFDQIPGGLWHVAIVSDKRRKDGVPYLIHNYGSGVKESDYLETWPTEITGHYRDLQ